MKILYIQPWGFADYSQLERFRKGFLKRLSLPRVMFEVMYFVVRSADFDYLDLNLELLENPDKTARQIIGKKLKNGYDAIFLTFPTVALGNLIGEIIKDCKKFSPQTPIVLGGEAVELMGEDIMAYWPVDYLVDYLYDGYGQEIPQILDLLVEPEKIADIAGLIKRTENGELVYPQQARGQAFLLDNYGPEEFYTLKGKLDFSRYLERYCRVGIKPSAFLEMTRGCSHSCAFCAINKSGQVLCRNPETVAAEAEYLLKQGIENFYLIDPTLGLQRDNIDKLLASLAKIKVSHPELSILAVTRTSLITEKFAQKMKIAGITSVGIGIETMADSQLKKIKKGTIPEQAFKAVKILNGQEIRAKLFLIHFPDYFSRETIKFLLALAKEKLNFIAQSSFYRPLYQKGRYALAPDFRIFDQRIDCHSLKIDSTASILEWLLCNLPVPSTDINAQMGDSAVLAALEKIDWDTFTPERNPFQNLLLRITKNKYYLYCPEQNLGYIKPNLYVGDDYQQLDASDCLIIDLTN